MSKKSKKLTNKEKALRAEAKKSLQIQGILPPDKPRLNRKKFTIEVMDIIDGPEFSFHESLPCLLEIIGVMTPTIENGKVIGRVTEEHIGVLKLLKMTADLQAYIEAKKKAGEQSYSVKECYDVVILPTINLQERLSAERQPFWAGNAAWWVESLAAIKSKEMMLCHMK